MADFRNLIDGGAHGSVATSASTAASGVQLTIGGVGSAAVTWDSDEKIGGDASIKIQPVPAGQSRYLGISTPDYSSSASMVGYFRLTAHPTTADQVAAAIMSTSGATLATCEINAAGGVTIRSANGTAVGSTSTNKVATSTWYRVELAVKTGSGGSSLVTGKVSPALSTTAIHSASSTAINLTGFSVGAVRLGWCIPGSGSQAFEHHYDCMRVVTGSTTLLGPWLGDPIVVDSSTYTDPGLAIVFLRDQVQAKFTAVDQRITAIGGGTGGTGGTTPVASTDFAAIITN